MQHRSTGYVLHQQGLLSAACKQGLIKCLTSYTKRNTLEMGCSGGCANVCHTGGKIVARSDDSCWLRDEECTQNGFVSTEESAHK